MPCWSWHGGKLGTARLTSPPQTQYSGPMPRSMTGFGRGVAEHKSFQVCCEAHSVNHRYLKVAIHGAALAPRGLAAIEKLVRQRVARGSVQIRLQLTFPDPARLVSLNEPLARAYQAVFRRLDLAEDSIPTLPGVLESVETQLGENEWSAVERAIEAAVSDLVRMRDDEGRALADAVTKLLEELEAHRLNVARRAPEALKANCDRLRQRIQSLLGPPAEVSVQDLAREIAMLADRADIAEELQRLHSHVFGAIRLLQDRQSVGRELEFYAQEMLREANTMGAKANDAAITGEVVLIKGLIEQIKEQAANVE